MGKLVKDFKSQKVSQILKLGANDNFINFYHALLEGALVCDE